MSSELVSEYPSKKGHGELRTSWISNKSSTQAEHGTTLQYASTMTEDIKKWNVFRLT